MAAERMAPAQLQRSLRDPKIDIPDGEPDADGPLNLEALTLSECETQKAQAWGYLLWDFLLPPLSPFMVGFGVGVPGSQFDYASKGLRTTAAIIKGIGWAMPFIGIGAIFAHASDVNSDPERAANGLDDGIIIAGGALSLAGPLMSIITSFVMYPKIGEMHYQACLKHMEEGSGVSCAPRRPSGLETLAVLPLMAPTASGDTAYGFNAGFAF